MNTIIRLQTVLFAAALMAPAAAANAQNDEETIEEIYVYGKDFAADDGSTGTKTGAPLIETPISISVISRDLLDSWNVRKMTEALRYTPGVQAEPFGIEPRFTSVRLRGFGATSEGLFRDGLIMLNPFFIVSYNLEPYGAERVEIPRGPISVLYGQGSPGGLVNYISKMPRSEAFGEVGLVVGNHDRIEGQIDFGGPVAGSDTVSYRLTGLVRNSDTQIDFVPEDRQYFAGAFEWQLGDRTSLTLLANTQQDDTMNSQALPADGTLTPNPNGAVPISRFTGEPTLDVVDRTEYSAGYQFEHFFSDNLHFFQNARFNDVDLDDVVVFSFGLEPDMRTITRGAFASYGTLEAFTMDNQLHWNLYTGNVNHKLLFGIDYINASGTKTNAFNGSPPGLDVFDPEYFIDIPLPDPFEMNDVDIDSIAAYFQDQIKFGDHWIVNLAMRYDNAESETFSQLSNSVIQNQTDDEVTYRAGVVYLTDNGFAPYVSYAESFLPSTGVDGNGNPFEPERGEQIEVGIKYEPRGFDAIFTLAYFDLERENIVDRDINFVLFQTGEAASTGVEFEAYMALDNGLSVIGNFNYLDTEFLDHPDPEVIGKEFTQIPDQKASVWLDYSFQGPLSGLGFGIGVRYQSETYSDDLNTITSPSFTLYDAAVHYEWDRFRFALNVQNLTDKEYTSSCFTRNSLLCTFGETRAIRGSVLYRWGG